MDKLLRDLRIRHINIYLSQHIEESLVLRRGEQEYAILALTLSGEAHIEDGNGIGTLALEDSDIETDLA